MLFATSNVIEIFSIDVSFGQCGHSANALLQNECDTMLSWLFKSQTNSSFPSASWCYFRLATHPVPSYIRYICSTFVFVSPIFASNALRQTPLIYTQSEIILVSIRCSLVEASTLFLPHASLMWRTETVCFVIDSLEVVMWRACTLHLANWKFRIICPLVIINSVSFSWQIERKIQWRRCRRSRRRRQTTTQIFFHVLVCIAPDTAH